MPPRKAKKASTSTRSKTVTGTSHGARSTHTPTTPTNPTKKVTERTAVRARLTQLLAAPCEEPIPIPSASPLSRKRGTARHLSIILHAAFLVTMAEKAQLGVAVQTAMGATAKVDARWLAAVVRYCGFTVTLTDVLECGAAFSEWLHLTVRRVAADGVVVRLKLLHEGVPPLESAEAFLKRRWGRSHKWREEILSLTTFPAGDQTGGDDTDPKDSPTREGTERSASAEDGGLGESDAALLGQLSNELRNSLSAAKLRAVLAQMRRDVHGQEEKEQEEITKRQRRERILSTYDLLRSLFGVTRMLYSAEELMQRIAAENRFGDDVGHVLDQLIALTQYEESGVKAFTVNSGGEGGADWTNPVSIDLSRISISDLGAVMLRWDRHTASRTKLYVALQKG